MKISFFDRQDSSNPHQGGLVQDEAWLMMRIEELREREPSFCEMESENGFKLLLGVGHDRGCAQYSALDGSPPYLMATDVGVESDEEYMEFLTANTDTPVPRRYCLPIDEIREIATEFLASGSTSQKFYWEEI